MNTRVSHALRASSLTLLAAALLSLPSFSALAASCDPALAQRAEQIRQQRIQEEAQRAEDIYKGHNEQPDWIKNSDGLLTACMSNNWPKISVSSPALQKLLSGAQEKATKEACDRARDSISSQTGKYQDMLKTIPGFKNVTGGSNNFGNWGQIGDLAGDVGLPTGGTGGVSWNDLIPGISNPGGGTTTPRPDNSGGSIPGITP